MFRLTGKRFQAQMIPTKPLNYLQHIVSASGSNHPCVQIARRNAIELQNMARHLKLDPEKTEHYSVALGFTNKTTNKDVAFHIIRQMITKVSTKDQKEFDIVAQEVYEKLSSDGSLRSLEEHYMASYASNKSVAADLLDGILEGESALPKILQQHPTMSHLTQGVEQKTIALTEQSCPVLEDIIQDVLTAEQQRAVVSQTVSDAIDATIAAQKAKQLPYHSVEKSKLTIIGGHAGSGKGYMTGQLIEQGWVVPENTCRVTPDDYHGVLQQLGGKVDLGSDKSHHGELCHELVTPIIRDVETDIRALQETQKKSPDVVKEVIVISQERVIEAAKSGQQVRFCATVHHDIEAVVQGAHNRFLATGRNVFIGYIYDGQKFVSKLMPGALASTLQTPSNNVRVELYNTTHIHDKTLQAPNTPVTVCDADTKKTLVFRLDDFIKFNSKQKLTIPKSLEEQKEVNQQKPNDKELVSEFLENYDAVKGSLVFIDPSITKEQVSQLEEHVYAHVDDDTGALVIDNPTVYNRVKKESKLSEHFFETLEKTPELRSQQQL